MHRGNLRITSVPSNLTKYAEKTLCTKTLLSRGVTGKTFPGTEKKLQNYEMKPRFRLGLPYWQPSKKLEFFFFRKYCNSTYLVNNNAIIEIAHFVSPTTDVDVYMESTAVIFERPHIQ